jgi:hypothetical protein
MARLWPMRGLPPPVRANHRRRACARAEPAPWPLRARHRHRRPPPAGRGRRPARHRHLISGSSEDYALIPHSDETTQHGRCACSSLSRFPTLDRIFRGVIILLGVVMLTWLGIRVRGSKACVSTSGCIARRLRHGTRHRHPCPPWSQRPGVSREAAGTGTPHGAASCGRCVASLRMGAAMRLADNRGSISLMASTTCLGFAELWERRASHER